jgi:hypothetical protein
MQLAVTIAMMLVLTTSWAATVLLRRHLEEGRAMEMAACRAVADCLVVANHIVEMAWLSLDSSSREVAI